MNRGRVSPRKVQGGLGQGGCAMDLVCRICGYHGDYRDFDYLCRNG